MANYGRYSSGVCPPARRVAVFLCLAAAASCGDPFRPAVRLPADVVVTLARIHPAEIVVEGDGSQSMRCAIELLATAAGGGAARWEEARFRWFAGSDTVAFDSSVIDAATIRDSWGADTIATGEILESGWTVWAGIPFSAQIEYRYFSLRDSAAHRTAVRFTCGAAAPGAPPTIDTLVVRPGGVLEPGDAIEIEYRASSGIGLWETGVILSGACDSMRYFGEQRATTMHRTVQVVLPSSCRPGEPLVVTAVAWDAALTGAHRSMASPPLQDTTPPLLWVNGTDYGQPHGDFMVGETVPMFVTVRDNHTVRMLWWENLVTGSRDSMAVDGADNIIRLAVAVQPGWEGAPQFRFTAVDASGHAAVPWVTAPDAFNFYRRAPAAWSAPVGDMDAAILDTRRNRVYLLHHLGLAVSVFDVATRTIVATVAMPQNTFSMDLMASGDSLVLAGYQSLHFIDLASLQRTSRPLNGLVSGQFVESVRALANGKLMIFVYGSTVWNHGVVDPATGDIASRNTWLGAFEPSLDRRTVIFVGNPFAFTRYDVGSDTYGATVVPSPAGGVGGPSVDSTGRRVLTNADVWENDQLVSRIHGVTYYTAGAINPDGQYSYVHGGPGVVRARASDGRRLHGIPTDGTPIGLRVSEDGRWLLMLLGNGRVSVYDLNQLN